MFVCKIELFKKCKIFLRSWIQNINNGPLLHWKLWTCVYLLNIVHIFQMILNKQRKRQSGYIIHIYFFKLTRDMNVQLILATTAFANIVCKLCMCKKQNNKLLM